MAEEPYFVSTEFDIFDRKPKQSSTVQTNETIYRPIASVDQTDIEFVIPGYTWTWTWKSLSKESSKQKITHIYQKPITQP